MSARDAGKEFLGEPVPGFEEDGLCWLDTPGVVTITMPISGDDLRSLAVHTDGSTLSLSWDRGSVSGACSLASHERRTERRDSRVAGRSSCVAPAL